MSTDTNLFRGMNLPIVNNGELGSSWASYREHQDMESDKLCNNIVNSWPAKSPTKSTVLFCSVEFQGDRGGKARKVKPALIIQTENETTISEIRRNS